MTSVEEEVVNVGVIFGATLGCSALPLFDFRHL
jgi:hypothetical protein